MTTREDLLIIAHRGASADYPDNTRESFVGAADQGADWVELDVRIASDGTLIVNHDPWYHDQRTVWDTPSGERPPSILTLRQALDACGAWRRPHADDAHSEGSPRRESVDPPAMGVNIEIKNSPGDLGGDHVPHSMAVVDAVLTLLSDRGANRSQGGQAEVMISSFDQETIDYVRLRSGPPTAQLVLDVASWPDVLESTAERGHAAVNPWDPFVDSDMVRRAHGCGLALFPWTVDDPARLVELATMGVDGIITDVPAVARRYIGVEAPPDGSRRDGG